MARNISVRSRENELALKMTQRLLKMTMMRKKRRKTRVQKKQKWATGRERMKMTTMMILKPKKRPFSNRNKVSKKELSIVNCKFAINPFLCVNHHDLWIVEREDFRL